MVDLRSGVRRAIAVLLLLGLVPVPCFGATQPYGGATPQELVARMQAAAASQDIGELMACMAPQERKAMGGTMVMMAVMMVGFSQMGVDMGAGMAEGMAEALGGEEMSVDQRAEMEAQKAKAAAAAAEINAKLRAALEPHGLGGLLDGGMEAGEGQDEALQAALEKADMIALTESVMDVLAEMKDAEPEGDGSGGPDLGPGGMEPDWTDLEVTDYQIDGDQATAQAGDETLEMIRVDGRWYFAPQPETAPSMDMETTEMQDGRVEGT